MYSSFGHRPSSILKLKQKYRQANTSPSSTPSGHVFQHEPSSASGLKPQSPSYNTHTIRIISTVTNAQRLAYSSTNGIHGKRAYLRHWCGCFDRVAVGLDGSAGPGRVCFLVLTIDLNSYTSATGIQARGIRIEERGKRTRSFFEMGMMAGST